MSKKELNQLKFQAKVSEERRLQILICLETSPGYVRNERLLMEWLEISMGHKPSSDQLRNDLMWLVEMEFLTLTRPKNVWTARISPRGLDVATGKASAYGVATRGPDD